MEQELEMDALLSKGRGKVLCAGIFGGTTVYLHVYVYPTNCRSHSGTGGGMVHREYMLISSGVGSGLLRTATAPAG